MSTAVLVCPGARFSYDGEIVEVTGFEGGRVTVRDPRGRWRVLSMAAFLGSAAALEVPASQPAALGPVLAGLPEHERERLAGRAAHVREVLTGYRSGTPDAVAPGEPRPAYAPGLPLQAREAAKAAELGVSSRTVRRWLAAYRAAGEAGLVDARQVTGRGAAIDARWEEAGRLVIAGQATASTPTAGALLEQVRRHLEEQHGPGVVPQPSRATAYRHLTRLAKGTNAVRGSAKGRRSIADRPKGVYGRLRACRPGEYAILDTQDLDVFAMEPVTCRWVRAQLTAAQDLFTRGITGLRVTPVSTKAVDVAGVLYQAVVPQPAPEHWPEEACWPYHGVPQHLVFSEQGRLAGVPACPPETLVIDHGKAFLSAHVISVCTRLGISVQPAQPKKPTDKPTLERFFKTLREGLIQHLPAYKGPDIYSRGEHVEDGAFLFISELEDIIREWVALVYHRRRQDGLAVPEWPHLKLSPNEMYEIGVAKAGLLRIPATPELAYDFLQVSWRTIQHYGVEMNGLRYNGPALDGYRNTVSPYSGEHAGKWPVRVNPDDVRWVFFQDPADNSWHRLEWEHTPSLGTPFSAEAAACARRLAARDGTSRHPGQQEALAGLLAQWDQGMVTSRRERRIAVRLAAERAAVPLPGEHDASAEVALLPTVAATAGVAGTGQQTARADPVQEAAAPEGDDDDGEEIFDTPDDDYYADAFEVIG